MESKFRTDDLIADLSYMRKSEGFKASRIHQASSLLDIIGGKNQIFEAIQVRFTSAIHSLSDKENAEALLAAYGLLPGYENIKLLKDRRAKYSLKVNRKYDTLSDREDAAIEELAVRLLTAYYSGAPLPAELPMPHGGYLLTDLKVTTMIEDCRFVKHEQHRRIIPLAGSANSFKYHNNRRTKLIPIGRVTVTTKYVENGTLHELHFPKEVLRGHAYTFGFQEILEEPEQLPEELIKDFAGQSFETPSLGFTQTVIFSGAKPAVIWSYDKLSRIERPGEPTNENILTLNNDGVAQKEFFQQYGGLHSGIAWRWKLE